VKDFIQVSKEDLQAQTIDSMIKALSCNVRRNILHLVRNQVLQPREIAETTDCQINVVKRHLSILSKAGLLLQFKRGNVVAYQLKSSALSLALNSIENVHCD